MNSYKGEILIKSNSGLTASAVFPPPPSDPHSNSDGLNRPIAHFLYAILAVLCVFMILFSIATFFWYRAYRNTSSMTLIGLQVLMWFSTGIMWVFCFFDPPSSESEPEPEPAFESPLE